MQPTQTNQYGSLGSAENLNKLLAGLGAKTILPKTPTPSSVTDATSSIGSFSMPSTPTTFVDPFEAMSTAAGQQGYADTLKERFKFEQDLAKQKAQQNTSFLSKLTEARPDKVKIKQEAESQFDTTLAEQINQINTVTKEMSSLNESLNAEIARRDTALAQFDENKNGMSQGGLDFYRDKLNKQYAVTINQMSANINAKAAVLETMRGNYKMADDYVNKAVDAATAQYKDDLDALTLWRDISSEQFDALSEPYKNAYDSMLDMKKMEYEDEREKAMARYKASLSDAGGYTEQEKRKLRAAGIDPTDIQTADEYLYGSGTRAPKNEEELQMVLNAIIEDGGEDAISGTYGEFKLSPEQQNQYRDLVTAKSSKLYKASNIPVIKQAVDVWNYLFD